MPRRLVQCRKCSCIYEVPPTVQTTYCSRCGTYSSISKTASQSNLGYARGSWSIDDSYSRHISNQISSSRRTQPRSNKRALLCGVSYYDSPNELSGTINDVRKMEQFLTQGFNFPKQSIRILTDNQPNKEDTPTRKKILESLRWLVEDCQPGDSLVFYFAGHGSQQRDWFGDESDGKDEILCTADSEEDDADRKNNMIVDNEINSIIVKPLPPGVTLHAIIDACNSGTILDLHYIYNLNLNDWEEDFAPSRRPPKGTRGGLAICFSACDDNQQAVEGPGFSEKSRYGYARTNGVMTTLFTEAVEKYPNITYAGILEYMNEKLDGINARRGCSRRSSSRRLFNNGLLQEPQLTSSHDFNVDKIFRL